MTPSIRRIALEMLSFSKVSNKVNFKPGTAVLQEARAVLQGVRAILKNISDKFIFFENVRNSQKAINLFDKISSVGLMPDYVTFIGVLTACSHAGLVDLGFYYFMLMTNEYQINPSKEHYGCIIDLLCRAGQLSEAEHMIRSMPFHSDDIVWSTLLRACRVHGDVDRGRWTAEQLLQLDPYSAGTHITLANMYAAKGRWKEAAHIRKLMKSKGLIKEPGWSWINVNDQLNAFVAGDQAHPQNEHITTILELLSANIGDARQEIGSLQDVED
uniref:Pentatricopeptide repeat-containing protein At3g47840 family n=1 Tax=Cajanus cajan TaxID=3821 RepID=A0A151RAL6_CAJCA|nr:Putative pentatricopeptide repeat-containing protein At3g47840 family [Cajanus cajan]